MCGEKRQDIAVSVTLAGSPPHVRGKDADPVIERAVQGITPACAGKSHAGCGYGPGQGDHPRMCGEKMERSVKSGSVPGSPPHVRGKEAGTCLADEVQGITPACAGKSSCVLVGPSSDWDHPRMCGEKQLNQLQAMAQQGSPPHVRGKALPCAGLAVQGGITPACAGKRRATRFFASRNRDHPRMCGEKIWFCCNRQRKAGSPPHVRGKDGDALMLQAGHWITPACAGKSSTSWNRPQA